MLLTLPVTLVTLGLFLFVINALMFYFARVDARRLPRRPASGAALIGSLLYSLCGLVMGVALEHVPPRRLGAVGMQLQRR